MDADVAGHLPVLGEVSSPANVPVLDIDPFDDAFLADPYRHHDRLRDAGAVVWLDSYGVYAAARHAEVASALNDWQSFVSGRGVGLSDFSREAPWRPASLLLEADPPLHDRTRRIMNKVISISTLASVTALWRAEANRLVEDLVDARRFDAVTDLAEVFPLRIFPAAIGLDSSADRHLLPYAAAAFDAFGPRNALAAASTARACDAVAWVDEACRRENLSAHGWGMAVYRAADEGACDEREAHRLVRSLLTAGVDTTVNGIGNMIHAFARHPEEWAVLRAEPGLKKKAFEESLRWDSTVQTFFRTTVAPVELGGVRLAADAKIILFLAAANRDPRRWTDPERFDIRRQASGHVGFGFGIHQCLGQMMARLEAEVILDALLSRVSRIELAGEPTRRLNNTLHALASAPIEVTPA